jgi:PAS domain S-box-containing protein
MSQHESGPGYWTPILYDVAHALESVEDPEVRVDRVLRLMARFVPYDRCAVLEATPVLRRPVSIAPEVAAAEEAALTARLQNLLALVSERALAAPPRPPAARTASGVHLAVPIIGLGEITGIVFVERAAPAYEEAHLAFLSVIAAQLGAYLAAVRADRELRASEARFRRLYDSGMIGIAFMDGGGRITDANETFAAIVERSGAELRVGAVNWHGITSAEHRDRDLAALREAIERGACAPYPKRFVRRDGRTVTVLAGAAQLESPDTLVGYVLDVSEQERVESERAGLLHERERDLELLEMFVAMLGHDLRNPLGAIRMSAEYLRRSDAERLTTTARILASTDRMERMVDQLLDLTRIRLAGGMPLERGPVDLREICGRALDELKAMYPEAAIPLRVDGDVTGQWDGDRLLQAVSNLVANEIQHARGGRDSTLRVAGGRGEVELVTHNPYTIASELVPVLFDPFRGTERGSTRRGLGLGLFITRHIVEAHGGSIAVVSREGDGTTFTVRLPRQPQTGTEAWTPTS